MDADELLRFRIQRQNIQAAVVRRMNIRLKRTIFALMRDTKATPDTLLPSHGLTLGQFAVHYVLVT